MAIEKKRLFADFDNFGPERESDLFGGGGQGILVERL
jgi:hypothetical protein